MPALRLLVRDDHEAAISDQGAEPRQLVARRKQKSSRLPLSLFVDAPRERNDLSASAPSALASDFDNRTDVFRLVALPHVSAPLRLARSTSRPSGLADGFRRVAKELQPPRVATRPGPGSRDASFGHKPKRLHGLLVARAGEAISRLDAAWRSAFPLLEPEADEERPDCEHRAEHTEDDARRHQIGTSEGVYEEPKPTGEDQAGAELTEEERARRSRETPRRECTARKVASADRVM